jgi:hypothetical protein
MFEVAPAMSKQRPREGLLAPLEANRAKVAACDRDFALAA